LAIKNAFLTIVRVITLV